jgi:hypothetical protein
MQKKLFLFDDFSKSWRLIKSLVCSLFLLCVIWETAYAAKRSSESRPELSAALVGRYVDSGICRNEEECRASQVMLDRGGSDGFNINFYRVSNPGLAQLLISDILNYCAAHPGATANVAFYPDEKRVDSFFFTTAKPKWTLEVR